MSASHLVDAHLSWGSQPAAGPPGPGGPLDPGRLLEQKTKDQESTSGGAHLVVHRPKHGAEYTHIMLLSDNQYCSHIQLCM